jgi:hypothetical protein
MHQTWLNVVADGEAWIVHCGSALYGRFRTQQEAFNRAVAEARKIHGSGQTVQVRVLREGSGANDRYLSLL